MNEIQNCESCSNYYYDDEYGCYSCQVSLDEDEMGRFISDTVRDCSQYNYNDEYKIVRKQI